jgi:hypothetical protein
MKKFKTSILTVVRKMDWAGDVALMSGDKEGRLLAKHKCRWDSNIKMDVKGKYLVHLPDDKDALPSTIINIRFP